jgi:hypothetical protein
LAGAGPTLPKSAAVGETVLLGAGFVVLVAAMPHAPAGDDWVRFGDIETLIHHGHLTSSHYSLVGPLLSAPFLLLGEVLGTPVGWAAHFNMIVVGAGLLAAFVLTRGRVDAGLFRKFALVLLFASFLTDRLLDYNAEVLTATLVGLGTLAVGTGRRAVLGWAAMVIGVVNTPAALVGLVLVALVQASRTRRLRPLLAPVAAALLVMGEAWLRRGGPLTTGYEGNHGVATILPYSGRPGFSYPFPLGIVSILFSFGRGLVFFAPGLLLWLGPRTRRLVPGRRAVVLQLVFLAGLVAAYAKWWAWYGGLSWGPRFFVFVAIPASLFLAVRLHEPEDSPGGRVITLAVLVLSAWVGLAGAIPDSSQGLFCSNDNFELESLCWYTPDYSALWWPVLHFPALTAGKSIVVAYCALVFVWLAAPQVAALGRSLTAPLHAWTHGWRF